jgi:LacI family transcriptional regulator
MNVASGERRPTMKDVAGVAGVSLATVSRVVNGSDDVRIDLAARVHDAIAVLGYRRDLTASTLRRADRVSASIGLVFEDVSNPFFSAVHRGVEEVARECGVLTFAGSSDEDPDRERELAEAFGARGVDGLVIVPCSADQSYLHRDRQAGVALVFVDRPPRFIDADAVLSDNVGGARTGVEHLLAAGHRRIAFLGDRPEIFTAQMRNRGYREALAAAGVAADPALERAGLADGAAAAAAARDLLDLPDPPTALFTGQNLITIGAIRTLRDLGLQHKVGLVGFDDVVLGDMLEPGITVIAQDPYALGRRAAELLFFRLGGFDGESREVVLPTRLVARGSGELAPAGAPT